MILLSGKSKNPSTLQSLLRFIMTEKITGSRIFPTNVLLEFYYYIITFYFLVCFSKFVVILRVGRTRFTGRKGKRGEEGGAISLSPLYLFHPLHRHLEISRATTAESSPLHIGNRWTRTGNLWIPSTNR